MPVDIPTGLKFDDLSDNYYSSRKYVCDICGMDEKADVPEVSEQASTVSSTAVVETGSCALPHTFHRLCFHAWLSMKLYKDEDASCHMCRSKLVLSATSVRLQELLRESLEYADTFDRHLQDAIRRREGLVRTMQGLQRRPQPYDMAHAAILEDLRADYKGILADMQRLRQSKAGVERSIALAR